MTKKQLENYPYLKARIKRIPGEIERLYNSYRVIGAVQASQQNPPYAQREIIIGEKTARDSNTHIIAAKRSEYTLAVEECARIESFIEATDDARIKEILTLRYIYGESWRDVAAHIGYHETEESVRKAAERFLK